MSFGSRHLNWSLIPVLAVAALLVTPASATPPGKNGQIAFAASRQATVWNIVALGDSETTGEGDPTRLGWVGRYAASGGQSCLSLRFVP